MSDINNAFGRTTGNTILRKVSKVLTKYCRDNPTLGMQLYRFDGTDFVIIFNKEVSEEKILEEYE